MAKTFTKSILRAGKTYHGPDAKVTVTPERLRHWAEGVKRLQSAGYEIPMHWDHSAERELLEPIKLDQLKEGRSRSAANTVGVLRSLTVAEDGQSATIHVEPRDEKAREAMEKNRVFVSPVIFPEWTDGANQTHTDAITSVDLVNHPVDYSQGQFEPADEPLCCAIRMGLDPAQVYRLAFDEEKRLDETHPAQPTDKLGQVVAALADLKIILPEGTTPENILDGCTQPY